MGHNTNVEHSQLFRNGWCFFSSVFYRISYHSFPSKRPHSCQRWIVKRSHRPVICKGPQTGANIRHPDEDNFLKNYFFSDWIEFWTYFDSIWTVLAPKDSTDGVGNGGAGPRRQPDNFQAGKFKFWSFVLVCNFSSSSLPLIRQN